MDERSTTARRAVLVGALVGCAAPLPEEVSWDWEVDSGFEDSAMVAGNRTVLDGFIARRRGRDFAAGDRVLLGLRVEGNAGSVTSFVQRELVDHGDELRGDTTIRATVFEGSRRWQGSTVLAFRR